jgi:2-desacetyl-2-hydroxyethyl bacteriochlorophyllide A dehydrogenase
MKTAICQKPYEMHVTDMDKPTPAPGEALVKIRRVGVCGSDLNAFKGKQPYFSYPRILGHELAAEIETIPAGDHGLKTGDPVAVLPYLECGRCVACRMGKTNCCVRLNVIGVHSDGGLCETMAVPADHLVSAEGLDWDRIALVECLSIGAHAVRRANIQPGETALVVGAGPIGLGALQMARAAGARVIALDVIESRLAFCRAQLGIEHTITAGDDAADQLADITGGDFPTVVFEATGNAVSMKNSVNYLSHGGRLVYIGLVKGDITIDNPEFQKRETTLLSSRNATREDFARVMDAFRSGSATIDGHVTHRSSLQDLPNHFEKWTHPESGVIKAIVDIG